MTEDIRISGRAVIQARLSPLIRISYTSAILI